jgi:hypothetical protein
LLGFFVIVMLLLPLWQAGPTAAQVDADAAVTPTPFAGLKLLITYIGPALTIYGAVLAWAYLSASSRLGVVDLFACEIITLCRVGLTFDIAKYYVEQYKTPGATAAFVSEEDYFPVFDNNSRDLQLLESSIVNNITAFYTYMKATRDSLRKLALVRFQNLQRLS